MTPMQLINLRKTGQRPAESICVYCYPFASMHHMEPFVCPQEGDDLRGLMGLDVILIYRKHSRKKAKQLIKKISEVQPRTLHTKNMDTFHVENHSANH